MPSGHMIHHVKMGSTVLDFVRQIPTLDVEAAVQPITRTVLKVTLTICAAFKWNDRIHGKTVEPFWIWVEDPDNNRIYHSEYFMMHRKHVRNVTILFSAFYLIYRLTYYKTNVITSCHF